MTFENDEFRIADLLDGNRLTGVFENRTLVGPAVLYLDGKTSIEFCSYDELDASFWPVEPGRQRIVGAVHALDCRFVSCRFVDVGFAGPEKLRQQLDAGAWR